MSARGSSAVETVVATAILLPLLTVGYFASWSALESSAGAVQQSEESREDGRTFEEVGDLLRPASRSSLQAVPCCGEAEVEDMLDGYVYDNVRFRHVASVAANSTTYEPSLEEDPWIIEFQADEQTGGSSEPTGQEEEQRGDVVWIHDGRETVLASDCSGALFWRNDDILVTYIYWLEDSDYRVLHRSYLLRTP